MFVVSSVRPMLLAASSTPRPAAAMHHSAHSIVTLKFSGGRSIASMPPSLFSLVVLPSGHVEVHLLAIHRGLLGRVVSSITVRISLDFDAQTRVDALAASRVGRMDLGVNTRRLDRFFRALDAAMVEARRRRWASERQTSGQASGA